ncbi:igE-binding protein-like [Microcebus murinus]|uniref:igE-binding protein-like n=1 Tax=Microcebus murinus TaxID=30608 RepID=UPI003F6CCBC9
MDAASVFPVFIDQNNQRFWQPIDQKQLKELAEAVRNWGHGAAYTLALVERQANGAFTPDDWNKLTRAVLTTGQYLDWKSIYCKGCHGQARQNAAHGQGKEHWTYDMLTGQGQWANNQTGYPEEVYAQINSLAIKAWKSLPNRGEVRGNLTKIIQAPAEPFSDFVARLVEAAGKIFGDLETAMPLVEQLVYEQCTTECKNAIAPWKSKGLEAWLKACREIGGPLTNSGLAAAVLAAQSRQERKCYNCGKPGHLKRQCRAPKKQEAPRAPLPQPGICTVCGRGCHWSSECRSVRDKQGRPIHRDAEGRPVQQQKNAWQGPPSQGPQTYGVMMAQGGPQGPHGSSLLQMPGNNPFLTPLTPGAPESHGGRHPGQQDWTSVPPPQ